MTRIGHEIRASLSPLIGETPEQKMQRQVDLASIAKISPTLANYVQDSAANKTKALETGAIKAPLEHAADMGLEAGGATAGQAIGAFGGPFDPVTIPLGGAIGGAGGDYAAQKRRIAAGEQDKVDFGELAGAAIAGAIPGGSLGRSGSATGNLLRALVKSKAAPIAGEAIAEQAAKQAIGGYAAKSADTLIDEGRLPTAKEAAWASILPALGGAIGERVQQANPEIAAARTAAMAKDATKRAILSKAQDAGFVVEPSMVNPSMANKAIESMAGGPSIRQAATHINQEAANTIARKLLDPANPNAELTSELAQAVRKRAYDVGYRPIATAGDVVTDSQYAKDLQGIVANRQGAARSFPSAANNEAADLVKSVTVDRFDAGDALKMSQLLRNDAGRSFAQGNNELGMAQRQASKAIEDQVERHLDAIANGTPQIASPAVAQFPAGANPANVIPKMVPGQPPAPVPTGPLSKQQAATLLQDFRDARQLMAQSHDIEDAIREGGGSIIPSKLAEKFQAGKPLSGGLDTIGGFANNFPTITREGAKTAVPGTTITGHFARIAQGGLLAGVAGETTHSPEAAVLAGLVGASLPSIRGLVRNLVLSDPYQRLMTKIPVTVEHRPDLGALVIRQGAQAAGQEAAKDSN